MVGAEEEEVVVAEEVVVLVERVFANSSLMKMKSLMAEMLVLEHIQFL